MIRYLPFITLDMKISSMQDPEYLISTTEVIRRNKIYSMNFSGELTAILSAVSHSSSSGLPCR